MAKTGLRESRMNAENALEPEETLQVKNCTQFFFFNSFEKSWLTKCEVITGMTS